MTQTLNDAGTATAARWLVWLGLATAFLSMTAGGALFAFSTFVMPALRRLPARDGITAMQAINISAQQSLLLVPLVGSAIGGVAVGIGALARADTPHRSLVIAGGVLSVVALGLTIVYHQPHNLALGRLDPSAASSAAAWAAYAKGWVAWNHVRTAAALLGGVLLVAGLLRPR